MSAAEICQLTDRGVLEVTGADAQGFLQGLVTNDVEKLEPGGARHAALLTPQGKILFDFFIVAADDGYLIDVAKDKAAELAKRLGFYKLRAKVEIKDFGDNMAILAIWQATSVSGPASQFYLDPRLADMGWRAVLSVAHLEQAIADLVASSMGTEVAESAYHAHRIGLGVSEGGKDFAFGDAFPHEADMDDLHGVDFKKGCYVGQEVVSRMQHRGTARKRIVPVSADAPLPERGAEIRAGKALIGTLGSTAGNRGLALLRLDRAAEAIEKGDPIHAGDIAITLAQPQWAKSFTVPTAAAASAS